ncbi:MAG: hypothetical protein HOO06_06495 [Bdellovibrionaceae bacterium]|nr:hypothetical protein [Pseudobdellovibrionaceae bacterium]
MKLVSLFVFIICFSKSIFAITSHGRVTFGGLLSKEDHPPEVQGTTANNFSTLSTRLYYQASKWTKHQLVLTTDLRDKHDFFNKLDTELQQLSAKNDFQLRTLSIRNHTRKGIHWQAGRFHLLEAGSTFTDGFEAGYKTSSGYKASFFAGLNPKTADKSYLDFSSKKNIYGAYLYYEPQSSSWSKVFQTSSAYVTETFDGDVDRTYLYNQTRYQWRRDRHFFGQFYYDFVPTAKIQNAYLSYHDKFSKLWRGSAAYKIYDVIEYRRNADIRETLEPSPYKEFQLQAKYRANRKAQLSLEARSGTRATDNKKRTTLFFKARFPRIISKRFDASAGLKSAQNFTKNGTYLYSAFGYYSGTMELDINLDIGQETQTDGSKLNPVIIEVTASKQYSKKLFGALSLQSAKDEKVNISTAFFKFSYRFGTKSISPMRDGAAPRGRL